MREIACVLPRVTWGKRGNKEVGGKGSWEKNAIAKKEKKRK